MSDVVWTSPLVVELRGLWKAGRTASQCAALMQEKFGIVFSRNAIIGKAHRLGLSGRRQSAVVREPHAPRPPRALRAPQPIATEMQKVRRVVVNFDGRFRVIEEMQPILPEMPASEIPLAQRKTLMELTNETCRWPYGEPGTPDFFFCRSEEADSAAGRPYCRRHAAHAFGGRVQYFAPRRR